MSWISRGLDRILRALQTQPLAQTQTDLSTDLPPSTLTSETLAQLYDSQGHGDLARAIRKKLGGRPSAPIFVTASALDLDVRWNVQPKLKQPLYLRLAFFRPGQKPNLRDLPLSQSRGQITLARPRSSDGFVRAAIGHLDPEGHFTPIAHSPPVLEPSHAHVHRSHDRAGHAISRRTSG